MTIKSKCLLALLVAVLLPASAFARSTSVLFHVVKIWENINTENVTVSVNIQCTSGQSGTINQTTSISAVTTGTFTIDNMSDPADCQITEVVPDHYTADYLAEEGVRGDSGPCSGATCTGGPDKCEFDTVDTTGETEYVCYITNKPDPATLTINKTWVVPGGDQGFDGGYKIKLYCDSPVWAPTDPKEHWYFCNPDIPICGAGIEADYSDGNQSYQFTLPYPAYDGYCSVEEEVKDNVVEIDMSDCLSLVPQEQDSQAAALQGAIAQQGQGGKKGGSEKEVGPIPINAGDDLTCEIVNTAFFEGIPTLNPYGMAILAVLMLGVGVVGFRRFV